MRTWVCAWCLAFGLIGLAACGGSVIVETTTGEPGGQGGSGASGPGSGVGGDEAQSLCEQLCTIGAAFDCDTGGDACVSGCIAGIESVPDECKDEYGALLECIITSIPTDGCTSPDTCTGEVLALGTCLSGSGPGPGPDPGCSDTECIGTETSCTCKGICDGQTRAAECALDGNQLSCTCFLDGSPIATCAELDADAVCDLEVGCCGFYFGEGG